MGQVHRIDDPVNIPASRRTMIAGSAIAVLLVLLAVLYISLTHGSVTTADGSTTTNRAGTVTTLGADQVSYAELPAQARQTIDLIQAGGPYPYSRDGIVYENRSGALPRHTSGYYLEFTVPTPGATTRGTRRIISGQSGERYYTDDHYATFRLVVLP